MRRFSPASSSSAFVASYDSGWMVVLSSGLRLPGTRKKPAACSKAFGPRPFTFFRSVRASNGPFSSRWATIAAATFLLMPETYESSCADAVLASTPT